MTEKYLAYLQNLAIRDLAMNALATLALATVIAWEIVNRLPINWRWPASRAYLVGGMILFIVTLLLVASIQIPGG
jgi:hypothetical protein